MRRGDDAVRVAIECGTSVQMIYKHYMREIEEADAAGKPLHEQFSDAWSDAELRGDATANGNAVIIEQNKRTAIR